MNKKSKLLSEAVTRRNFLRAIALGSGAAVLAACAPAQTPAAPAEPVATEAGPAAPTEAPAATAEAAAPVAPTEAPASAPASDAPKPGGTFRALFGGEVPNLDAAIAFSWEDFWASYFLLFNRLYGYNDQNAFTPDLAADVPTVSADGLKYTVPIRKGVKFHDGSELTAEDVKFSFDRTLWPELKSPAAGFNTNIAGSTEVAAGTTKDLSGVKVIDPYTVEFTLKEPQSIFPAILTVTVNGIVPKKAVEAAGANWGVQTVIGTGPFKLKEWVQGGEKIVFERNTDYYKESLPYLDGVELYPKLAGEARVLRWENGDAEFVDAPPGPEVNRILADTALAPFLKSDPSPIFDYLELAANAEAFKDVRVRQAIATAIDKKTLADSFGKGAASVQEGIFTNGIPGYRPDFKSQYQYDPDKAKSLLTEAGQTGLALKMHVTQDNAERGQVIQSDLKAAGIELELVIGDFSTYKADIESGAIQMRWAGYGPDFPDLYPFVSDRFGCKKEPPPPPSAYCNEELAGIVSSTTALPVSDPKRLAQFQRVEDIVVNEDPYKIPLINRNFTSLIGKTVRSAPVYYYLPALEKAWLAQ
jgi:ABC-type transport system substrate-binding protein